MNKTRILKRSLLAAAVIASTSQAHAAGFQLNAQSATGIGRAFAGDAVIADNASSMARNPATMALFDKTSLSLGFEAIITDISVKDANGPLNNYPDYDDVGGTSVAPNIHLIVPVNDKFAWGINAYSNFGTSTDFSGSDVYSNSLFGGETDIKSMNIGLSGSYRLNEQWSFGAGLDIIYGKGTIRRGIDELEKLPPQIGGVPPGVFNNALNVQDADGWGVGFNIGTVYELNENNRFGLSYRYSPEITAKDDKGQEITLPLPDMAEFSGYHRIQDTAFAVHYSVQWIGWSAFDKIEFDNLSPTDSPVGIPEGGSYTAQYQWQDGWHYAIGGTWYVNDKFTLRTGYMHDTAAQDEITSISVPDSDRNWISGGATYHFNENSNLDFGITYLIGSDEDVDEGLITATTRADAILVGLQYSQQF
ncbi:outer membrane protein transport protein [Vibrio breoganii]|uniref:outer membrane protein transport protein n=1 Tax=Vibrio breoganii TaxID=553239 RepID=UPI0002D520CA|nr:OmpP1/FadL family transporter [Vibrio breoganii]OED96114.1 long-chain fatty acid transporter [Vibrio breoganii ZF-55]PMG96637.1 long-chain fatty acid transporter [Vibrio breoganii]PMJ47493.1 long-chain fatty acid transporter [Vibrio breoganii]PMK61170.1 long-chain fatty acid transporter [Vibrio breoganii]PMM82446.1 long-chain fatty acid transporter [Vibrio breoganii]